MGMMANRNFLYPVKISSFNDDPTDRVKWLLKEIGYKQWSYDWVRKEFQFKTEEDKVKFILRWL